MSVVAGLVAGTIIAGVRGLTDTSGQKLDIIIEGIGILKEYCEKDLQLSKEEKKEWETRAVSWLRAILDPEAGLDIKLAGWDSSIKPNLKDRSSIDYEPPTEKLRHLENLLDELIKAGDLGTEEKKRGLEELNRSLEEKEHFQNEITIDMPDGKKRPSGHMKGPEEDYLHYDQPDKSERMEGDSGSLIDQKLRTVDEGLDKLALKVENLLGRLSLVDEAKADELTDADKKKTASDEGKTTDTAILDELKLLKESFAAQIASGRAALSEARDQVIFAREAVTTLQTKVATLSVVVTNLKLPKSEEPKINEYVEYQLDSTYARI
jgi:hypothetical protein